MCNAWNHPPSCMCGWGGEGHAGRRTSSSSDNHWVPPINLSYESFTNPNASCPVCGSPVFFYRSPEGGSVFFDELGPPWPKHPCTNNSSVPARLSRYQDIQPSRKIDWRNKGWAPMELRFEFPVDKYFCRIHGIWKGSEIDLYVRKSALVKLGKKAEIQSRTLAHLHLLREGTYELSILDSFARPVDARVYGSLALAREFEPPPLPRISKRKRKK